MKTILPIAAFAIALALPSGSALAHHGWSWTTGGNVEVVGTITSVQLGNPHGVLEVDVNGELWTVEVGQPWRNARAGLQEGDLAAGVEIRAIGEPSADLDERRVKATHFYLGDEEYVLYPGRQ